MIGVIDVFVDGLDFVLQCYVIRIDWGELCSVVFGMGDDGVGQFFGFCIVFGLMVVQYCFDVMVCVVIVQCLNFCVGIGGEMVDCYYYGQFEVMQVFDMVFQIGVVSGQSGYVFGCQIGVGDIVIYFQCLNGCNQYYGIGGKFCQMVFDVQKFFGFQICVEVCFGDDII